MTLPRPLVLKMSRQAIPCVIVDNQIVLERMEFPEPVISVAVEPRSEADQEKMGVALGKLAQEDPSFRVRLTQKQAKLLSRVWVNYTSISSLIG